MRQRRFTAYGELLSVVVIWGIASVVIKATLDGIAPIPFLTYRFFLSTVVALPFLGAIIKLFKKKPELVLLTLLYCVLSTPLALGILFIGLEETSVINLSLIQALQPLLMAYIGSHLFHDHLTKRAKIGVGIAICGVFLTLIEPLLFAYDGGTLKGNLLLTLYILADVGSLIVLKKLLKKNVSPTSLIHTSFIVGFIVFLGILLAQMPLTQFVYEMQILPFRFHIGVWYMALFSGTIAFILRAKSQKTLNVTESSVFGYLSPVISTLLAILFLNEHITASYLLGAALIAIGVFLAEYKRRRRA